MPGRDRVLAIRLFSKPDTFRDPKIELRHKVGNVFAAREDARPPVSLAMARRCLLERIRTNRSLPFISTEPVSERTSCTVPK